MRYEIPGAVEEVARLLSKEAGVIRILAGGTDVIAQMNSGFIEPDLVIDIKRLPGFRDITAEKGGYRIGAAVPCAEMSEHPGLKALWPGVVEAAALIGSTQIQGRATIVGNICNGSPAADSVPALVAADAVATIVGPKGRRELPVADVPPAPGRRCSTSSEIVKSIFLPARPKRDRRTPISVSCLAPRWISRWSASASVSPWTKAAPAPPPVWLWVRSPRPSFSCPRQRRYWSAQSRYREARRARRRGF